MGRGAGKTRVSFEIVYALGHCQSVIRHLQVLEKVF